MGEDVTSYFRKTSTTWNSESRDFLFVFFDDDDFFFSDGSSINRGRLKKTFANASRIKSYPTTMKIIETFIILVIFFSSFFTTSTALRYCKRIVKHTHKDLISPVARGKEKMVMERTRRVPLFFSRFVVKTDAGIHV